MVRKKKTNRAKLMARLDVLSKQLVKQRDGNNCVHCGKWVEGSNRQASHVIPVSAGSGLKWDVQNMKVLCMHCHLQWWHKNPIEAGEWFKEKYPERWAYLQTVPRVRKWTEPELEALIEEYESQSTPD